MSALRTRLFSLVALATLLVAGCGRAPLAAESRLAAAPAVRDEAPAGGHKRGYDVARARAEAGKVPTHAMPRQGLLPPRVDLRSYCPPPYDQGELGCCTAFAIAKGLRELQQRQRNETPTPLSALFLYYMERYAQGKVAQDSGATVADGMKVLASYGVAPEADWPFQPASFTVRPPDRAYTDAANWRVKQTYHLGTLADVKASLARGYAVVAGFEVYQDFDHIGADGWMRMPAAGAQPDGGHAAVVVGYDDPSGCLIVRNSYGPDWGAHGYFYMPYAYASSKLVDEYWAAW